MKINIIAIVILSIRASVFACNVPVFRYALERWPVSPYRAVVVKDKELTKDEKAVLELLDKVGNGENGMLNLVVWNPNKKDLEKTGLDKVIPEKLPAEATLYLMFPMGVGMDKPFWTSKLSKETVKKLKGDAFRQNLVKKILEGNSGVFVLMESGDKKKDDKVGKDLEGYMKEVKDGMELPPGVVAADGTVTGGGAEPYDPINQLRSAIPLKLAFTTIRFDPKSDEVMTSLLMSLGPEGSKPVEKEPMVFAVYGRGRALSPMVGDEINLDNIGGIAYFFTGACSCQMKALNPGTDLLLDHDWDSSVFGMEE